MVGYFMEECVVWAIPLSISAVGRSCQYQQIKYFPIFQQEISSMHIFSLLPELVRKIEGKIMCP